MQTAEVQTQPKTSDERPTYEVIRSGDILEMRVQKNATFHPANPAKGMNFEYAHFARPVPGGMLNCHVHGGHLVMMLRGQSARFRVNVMKKIMPNSREIIMLDLYPVEASTPITGRLVIDQDYDGVDSLFAIQLPQAPSCFMHILKPGSKLPPTQVDDSAK